MSKLQQEKEDTILLRLRVNIDESDRTVSLTHPSLSGVLGFEFTTLDLAEIQLDAIREDKSQSLLEQAASDFSELISTGQQIKEKINDLRGSTSS